MLEQALRNTRIAQEAGADGVFLINHGSSHQDLLEVYTQVTAQFPGFWIGLNCLDLRPEEVFHHIPTATDGVWVDNAMIREDCQGQPDAQAVRDIQKHLGWEGIYFGGVAFKYQREVRDLVAAARTATSFMDVVTTSGPGPGQAALPEKIRIMKEAIEDHPLAIASGVTPENVHDYLPFTDCFLVATGISRSFEELDPARVRLLVDRVRSYRRP
jgi:predicted TIM-barrel enzyme